MNYFLIKLLKKSENNRYTSVVKYNRKSLLNETEQCVRNQYYVQPSAA